MSEPRFSLNNSLWVCGETITRLSPHARADIAAVRARGAEVFVLKSRHDREGLEQLRRLAQRDEVHIILIWLYPLELKALQPILRERKNFSVVLDDWWIIPHWFIREAEYKIFRKYNGIAVRLGQAELVGETPPWLSKPEPISSYSVGGAVFRLPALAVSPLVELYQRRQRLKEIIKPEKLLYFPFPVVKDSVPLMPEKLEYDFATTGSTYGIWLMRDAFAPFKHTFANLYYDRQRLANGIARFEYAPFKIYDWRRLNPPRFPATWEEYSRIIRQSRFVTATGGLHGSMVPKYLDYACLGTPMIGRMLPFEFPWLDECLFPVDILRLNPGQLKPLLHEAIERYPVLRDNCLKWRDRLLELYDAHRLLDMVQAQADGQPIPPGYLKPGAQPTSASNA
jgi:hypothetical protein